MKGGKEKGYSTAEKEKKGNPAGAYGPTEKKKKPIMSW